MRWLKIFALGTAALLMLSMLAAYFYLRSLGIVPRAIYEKEPPVLPAFTRPAVLVLNKANGYVHEQAIPAADAAFTALAADQDWDIFFTDNAATHNAADLRKFALVIWNNVSGDVLTEDQRTDLRNWIESGGGWLGVHGSGGDFNYQWGWYVDTLVGAQFTGHTMKPQFQDADVYATDLQNPLTRHLPVPWRVANEEWYAFAGNPREKGYEVLLTVDEDSYSTQGQTFFGNDRMPGEHPLAWRHYLGEGRVFYSAIGHQAATYETVEYRSLLRNAMAWAMDGR